MDEIIMPKRGNVELGENKDKENQTY